jgi:hypothetical protein
MERPDEVTEFLRCNGKNCDGSCAGQLDYLAVEDCQTWRVHGYVEELEKRVAHLEALNQQNLSVITMQERTRARLGERISELEAQVPRWISVEERLPEDDANVLVYAIDNNENSCIAMTSYTHNLHGFHIEGWRSPWQYFFNEHTITHWMPLPEPPKEEHK